MSTWVPMPCPIEGCGYIAQFQLEKTEPLVGGTPTPDPHDERAEILGGLSREHDDNVKLGKAPHPGGVDAIMTTDPAADDGT